MEYRTLDKAEYHGLSSMSTETGQMNVYFYRDGKKMLVFNESKTVGNFQTM